MVFAYHFNLEKEELDITITGVNVLLATRKSFSIPISHIVRPVVASPEAAHKVCMGFHLGIRLPGVWNSGIFWSLDTPKTTKTFIYMVHPSRTIMIELTNQDEKDIKRLILEVPEGKDAEQEAASINSMLAKL